MLKIFWTADYGEYFSRGVRLAHVFTQPRPLAEVMAVKPSEKYGEYYRVLYWRFKGALDQGK